MNSRFDSDARNAITCIGAARIFNGCPGCCMTLAAYASTISKIVLSMLDKCFLRDYAV